MRADDHLLQNQGLSWRRCLGTVSLFRIGFFMASACIQDCALCPRHKSQPEQVV